MSLALALVAVLSCFAGLGHAGGMTVVQENQPAEAISNTAIPSNLVLAG